MSRLVEVVRRGHLGRDLDGHSRAFVPSAFDDAILRVAGAAVESRTPVGIVLPVPTTNTPAILAAAVLVALFVETRKLDSRVTVASRQLRLRSLYEGLRLGPDKERLAEYFPAAVVLHGGSTSVSRSGAGPLVGRTGRLQFTVDLGRLGPLVGQQDGIIVESGAAEPEDVRRLLESRSGRVPIVYLTANPLDPVLEDLCHSGAVWAWTPAEVAELAASGMPEDAICAEVGSLRATAETLFEVAGPDASGVVDEAVMRLWDDLMELERRPGSPLIQGLAWAWRIYGAVSQLPVPVSHYDRQARVTWGTEPLADAPARAELFADNAADPDAREFWQVLAGDLTDVIDALQANPKAEALADWVTAAYNAGAGLVAVRNRAAVAAVEEYLDERPGVPLGWKERVGLTTFSSLTRGRARPCHQATLFSGPLSVALAGLLATTATRRLTVLTHGPWESRRAVNQIRRVADRLSFLAGRHGRDPSALLLFGSKDAVSPAASAEPRLVHSRIEVRRAPVAARDPVWDPFSLRIAGPAVRHDTGAEERSPSSPEPAGETDALFITFEDGVGFFDPHRPVSKVAGARERDVAMKALQPGDRVVLVDRGTRTDLFSLVVSRLEDLPEFEGIVMLVREWQERAARGYRMSGLTLEAILRRMREGDNGSRITTAATVGHWANHRVHGPDDDEDIRRFGLAVGDEVLVRRWQAIGRALRTMRQHRKKLGLMLARNLEGLSPSPGHDRGYFDRRLGIHLSDLAELVSDHKVAAIATKTVTIPNQFANVLMDPVEADRLLLTLKGAT
jgi:hypothetical protein